MRETATDWMNDAACKGYPLAWWFPERGEDPRPAKRICAYCPVLMECRQYSVEEGPGLRGIFGGLTENERWRLRMTGTSKPVCVECGQPYKSSRKTRKCIACREAV